MHLHSRVSYVRYLYKMYKNSGAEIEEKVRGCEFVEKGHIKPILWRIQNFGNRFSCIVDIQN